MVVYESLQTYPWMYEGLSSLWHRDLTIPAGADLEISAYAIQSDPEPIRLLSTLNGLPLKVKSRIDYIF